MTDSWMVESETGDECWRRCPSSSSYSVSDWGRVRRDAPAMGARQGRVLKAAPTGTGYLQVCLSEGGLTKWRRVHQLVAEAFIGPRSEDMDVCHNNGERTDNRLVNLRYDTRAGNFADMVRHGTKLLGERANSAKLTSQQAVAIWRRRSPARGASRVVAEEFGIHPRTVRDIWSGATWTHLTGAVM